MEIEILGQEDNPLLHRTDVDFEIEHEDATPSRLSVRDSLAAKLDKDSEEVVVHELDTKFGMRKTAGRAKVYDSPADASDVEHEHMLERNKIGEDADAVDTEDAEADTEDAEADTEDAEAEADTEDAEAEAEEAE